MKKVFKIIPIFILLINIAQAQNCNIEIEVLDGKYMFGEVTKMKNTNIVKKMEVQFSSEVMEVILQVEGQNYLIKVINQNCQAYCSKSKRIRQLHSGDEKIVMNLFADKHDDIVAQIKACGS